MATHHPIRFLPHSCTACFNRAAKFGNTVTFEDGTKVKVTSGEFVPVDQ